MVRHRLSAVSAVGETFPVFSSANGRAGLALLSNGKIRAFLDNRLFEETPNTITSMNELISEVEAVREHNYAVDNEEHPEGIFAVSVSVSVPVPTTRFSRSRDEITEALIRFRENLQAALHA